MSDQLGLLGVSYTAGQLSKALIERYSHQKWIVIPELRIGSGFDNGHDQRIDMWVMSAYPSDHMLKLAFEIKVSRADFKNELKKPFKRRWALRYSHCFYFVTPPDLIQPEELPLEAGLMVPNSDGKLVIIIEPPIREPFPPSWRLVASIARRTPLNYTND
jgi:hypothetical protein